MGARARRGGVREATCQAFFICSSKPSPRWEAWHSLHTSLPTPQLAPQLAPLRRAAFLHFLSPVLTLRPTPFSL